MEKSLARQVHRLHHDGVMEQMIDDEHRHNQAAHHHGARGVAGGGRLPLRRHTRPVARSAVLPLSNASPTKCAAPIRQPSKNDPGGPDDFRIGLEKVAVAIDGFRPEEDLQIARQMADNEKKQSRATAGHDIFLAERGTKQVAEKITHLILTTHRLSISENLIMPRRRVNAT